MKSFFDPVSGRRETVEITPLGEGGGHRFRNARSGFSRYPLENRTCYQCGQKGHLSANCPQQVRRVSLTEGSIKYEGAGETQLRLRLQSNMGSIPQHDMSPKKMMPGLKTVQVRLELINFWGLCLLWVLVNPDELARDAPPAPLRGSPCLQKSRPGTPSQAMQPPPPPPPGTPSQAMQPPPPPPPKLPAKFSQDPPPGVVASSGAAASSAAKPEPRPKTPPKDLPAKKPPGRTTTRLTEAALSQLKGSVGKVIQPKTPSPKRAVEEMLPPFRGSCLPEVSQCTPSSFPLLDGVYAFPKVLSLFDSQCIPLLASLCWMVCPPSRGLYPFSFPFVGWCVRLPKGLVSLCLPLCPLSFPLDGVSAFPRVLSQLVSLLVSICWMVCPAFGGS